jgi:hypothetical protein
MPPAAAHKYRTRLIAMAWILQAKRRARYAGVPMMVVEGKDLDLPEISPAPLGPSPAGVLFYALADGNILPSALALAAGVRMPAQSLASERS